MKPLGEGNTARLRAALREPDLAGTRYRLVEEAGAGGMGTVYVVEDPELRRQVALKVLDLPDPDLEARLRREAQVLARLEHPGIVPVHEVGTLADGRVCYTMKLVRGERLDLAAARMPLLGDRLRLFLRITEPVAFAHAQRVVHRDLKPENVMVGAFGEVLVLDWGLAKLLEEPAGLAPVRRTDDSAVVGTPGFMPPEQKDGRSASVDERADVYALGALLLWLAGPAAPAPVAAIAARASAAKPEDRYPDVVSLAAEVARFLDGAAVHAYAEGPWRRLVRLARRHRVALGVLVAYAIGRALILLLSGR